MKYETPTTTKEAATMLSKEKGEAYVFAGGTDLMVRMRMGMIEPALMVDIKDIPAMQAIKVSAAGTKIGAAVSGAELGENKALVKLWPGVVEATNLIGSDQIQGRCTMAGNLCNASPAADSVPALIAAGAKAIVVGPTKRRVARTERLSSLSGAPRATVSAGPAEPLPGPMTARPKAGIASWSARAWPKEAVLLNV